MPVNPVAVVEPDLWPDTQGVLRGKNRLLRIRVLVILVTLCDRTVPGATRAISMAKERRNINSSPGYRQNATIDEDSHPDKAPSPQHGSLPCYRRLSRGRDIRRERGGGGVDQMGEFDRGNREKGGNKRRERGEDRQTKRLRAYSVYILGYCRCAFYTPAYAYTLLREPLAYDPAESVSGWLVGSSPYLVAACDAVVVLQQEHPVSLT